MSIEEINERLERIEQMLDDIKFSDKKRINNEVKQMADNPINATDELISRAIEKQTLEASHLERLTKIYVAARERLGKISFEKGTKNIKAKQYVVDEITKKATMLERQQEKYKKSKDTYDEQKVLEQEQKERDILTEALERDVAIADGLELLKRNCEKHIESFKRAYKLYTEAMEAVRLSDDDIPEPEGNFANEIEEIEEKIKDEKDNLLTDANYNRLNAERAIIKELEAEGLSEENEPDDPDQKRKWEKLKIAKKTMRDEQDKWELDQAARRNIKTLKETKSLTVAKWKESYRQKHFTIAESQIAPMNRAIEVMKKNLEKKGIKSPYVEGIFDDAIKNREYTAFNDLLGESQQDLESRIEANKTKIEGKTQRINEIQLGIEKKDSTQTTTNATNQNDELKKARVEKKPKGTIQIDHSRDLSKSLEVRKLRRWEKHQRAYAEMKNEKGKKRFCPILWFKSLTNGTIEAWENKYVTPKQEEPDKQQVAEAKKAASSRREAFAKTLLYEVIQQSGDNIEVTEDMYTKAYNAARNTGSEIADD